MRLVLDPALFAPESGQEALALTALFTTAARAAFGFEVVLLTNPPYLPGGENGSIDAWLDRRDPLEASAFREILANGLLANAASPSGISASDLRSPRRWHMAGSLKVRVERRPASDWKSRVLTLADAIDLVNERLSFVQSLFDRM